MRGGGCRRGVVMHRSVAVAGGGGDDGARADDGDGRCDLERGAAAEQEGLRRREQVAERPGGAVGALALLQRRWALQAPGERTAGPEEQRLDRGLRELELLRDLAVGEALPLAEEDRAALLLGHLLEHV